MAQKVNIHTRNLQLNIGQTKVPKTEPKVSTDTTPRRVNRDIERQSSVLPYIDYQQNVDFELKGEHMMDIEESKSGRKKENPRVENQIDEKDL